MSVRGKDGIGLLADDTETDAAIEPPRRRTLRYVAGGSALALIVAAGALWVERKPIVNHIITDQLRSLDIPASYQLSRVGLRTQRLENLVIGDPAHPDLTAQSIEVDVVPSGFGVRVTGLRAQGVRLRGRLHDGQLHMGALDKLLNGGGGAGPMTLPDIMVQVVDARASIASDYGPIGVTLDGQGGLASGFSGLLALASPGLKMSGCRLDNLRAPLDLTTDDGTLILKGPAEATQLGYSDGSVQLMRPHLNIDVQSDPALADLHGAISLAMPQAGGRVNGLAGDLAGLSGLLTFKGSASRINGSASLGAKSGQLGKVRSDAVKIGGNFAWRPSGSDRAASLAGSLTIDHIRPVDTVAISALAKAGQGTPLAPLSAQIAKAVRAGAQSNRLAMTGRFTREAGHGRLSIDGARFETTSGAHVGMTKNSQFTMNLPSRYWHLAGDLDMGGGGLPTMHLTAKTDGKGAINGRLTMADYAAGDARLSLSPIEFVRTPNGAVTLSGQARLDGPLPDGAVRGLSVPLNLRVARNGTIDLAAKCLPVRWQMLKLGVVQLDPATLRLCGLSGGKLHIGPAALAGRLGTSPLAIKARGARYDLSGADFAVDDLAVQIGAADASPVRMTSAQLSGRIGADGLTGTLAGGTAHIGPVPLDLSEIAGKWRFAGGKLALNGALRVSDSQKDARFTPLMVPDAQLHLVDGQIRATGTLEQPARKVDVAKVTIAHDLATGAGHAHFVVDHLVFGGKVQPDDLTPLTLGVVANVAGAVDGTGDIDWTSRGVTSTGDFQMKNMDFAAAFGPVSGFATNIHFDDLLAMRSAPHQHMTIKSVKAGVEVHDGEIDYALKSTQQAVIYGGRWPFSGGMLELLPATLNLDSQKPRDLTFRVIGLDAGAFINTLELKDISATGTFDGVLPMIFDLQGGRIEGGLLVARQQGDPPLILTSAAQYQPHCDPGKQAGTLAYVGAVSNAKLNPFSKLAFDALKNLRYRCLAIRLDGALDGEFVTQVAINGINEGTPEARKSFLARPFLGLPFIFNVRIEAPFRGLLNSAASLADPTQLIRASLGPQFAPVDESGSASKNGPAQENGLAVQPPDSDKTIKKEQK